MTQLVRLQSDGQAAVLFSLGQPALTFQTTDPRLPPAIAAGLAATLAGLLATGASLIHMEQDATRAFTHTVTNGVVLYADGISDPIFAAVMDAQAALVAALTPEQAP